MAKQLSGAAKRKRAKLQAGLDRSVEIKRRRAALEAPGGPLEPLGPVTRQGIGNAPDDVVERVAWANKAGAQCLAEIMADDMLESKERWKLAAELVRSVGMTSVKALYEQRLKRLEGRLFGKGASDANGDGLEDEEP